MTLPRFVGCGPRVTLCVRLLNHLHMYVLKRVVQAPDRAVGLLVFPHSNGADVVFFSRNQSSSSRWLSFKVLTKVQVIFLCLDSLKGCCLTLVAFIIIFPALDLIGTYKSSVNIVVASKNGSAVLFDVNDICLIELKVILSAFIQVTWLSNYHSWHFVCNELLSAIQSGHCSEWSQPLPLKEFD